MRTASLKMAVRVAMAALTAPSIGSAQYYADPDYRYDDRRSQYDGRRSEYDGRRPIYGDRAIRAGVLASINDTLAGARAWSRFMSTMEW